MYTSRLLSITSTFQFCKIVVQLQSGVRSGVRGKSLESAVRSGGKSGSTFGVYMKDTWGALGEELESNERAKQAARGSS